MHTKVTRTLLVLIIAIDLTFACDSPQTGRVPAIEKRQVQEQEAEEAGEEEEEEEEG